MRATRRGLEHSSSRRFAGENAINAPLPFALPNLPALPFQKEVMGFSQDVMTRAQRAYEAFTAPVNAAK